MKFLRIVALLTWCCAVAFAGGTPLVQLAPEGKVRADITGNGRDSATLKLTNTGDAPLDLAVPAGSVLEAQDGSKQVVLRTLETKLEPRASVDASLPTAALSSRFAKADRALSLSAAIEPRLAALLKLIAEQNDLPRAVAQLAVFSLLEDIEWPAWRAWLAANTGKPAPEQPAPAEIAQAVDALALIRLAAPDRKPTMLADAGLKRLVLRNSLTRAKAMALYGMTVDDATTGEPAAPPDIKQLLHISPNDNCPICRMRQSMQQDPP